MGTTRPITPLPYKYYYLPVIIINIIGIVSCVYLGVVHYKNYTDIAYSSLCAITKSINCDTVAQSPYSVIFSLPVAHWGFWGFVLLLFLLVTARSSKNHPAWLIIFPLGIVSSTISLYFGYISATKISSYCIYCITCYACYLSITFYAYIILQRFQIRYLPGNLSLALKDLLFQRKKQVVLLVIATAVTINLLSVPPYWHLKISEKNISSTIDKGVTPHGHPWIGAREPEIIIHEYTDYLCFQCYKTHFFLRNLIREYPNKIRLVHHNFPLDHKVNPLVAKGTGHIGAGDMALIAVQTAGNENFWRVNDELYNIARSKNKVMDLYNLAEKVNINANYLATSLQNQHAIAILKNDIYRALKHEITSTPAFIVDGKAYSGTLPEQIFILIKEKNK